MTIFFPSASWLWYAVLVKSVSGAAAHTVPAGLVEDPNVTPSFLQLWKRKSGINMHKWHVGTISGGIFSRRWLLLDSRTHANWSCRRWSCCVVASRSAWCVKSIWHDLTIQTVQQTFEEALRKALSRDEACCCVCWEMVTLKSGTDSTILHDISEIFNDVFPRPVRLV